MPASNRFTAPAPDSRVPILTYRQITDFADRHVSCSASGSGAAQAAAHRGGSNERIGAVAIGGVGHVGGLARRRPRQPPFRLWRQTRREPNGGSPPSAVSSRTSNP